MPFLPSVWEQVPFLGPSRDPTPLVDVGAAAVLPAVERARDHGVLEALHEEPRSPTQLARDLDLDPATLAALLRVLASAGYVTRSDDGTYRTTSFTDRWVRGGDDGLGPVLRMWDEVLLPFWREHLDPLLARDREAPDLYAWVEDRPEKAQVLVNGYIAYARKMAPALTEHVELPEGTKRLVDVGGSHGHYSAALCAAHPGLRATVVDRPAALEVAKRHLPSVPGGEDVVLHPGHPLEGPLPEGFHVALLGHVVHSYPPEELPLLLQRTADALYPGGRLLVLDQYHEVAQGELQSAFLDVLGLHHRIASGGRLHTIKDLGELLERSGFTYVGHRSLPGVPATGVVVADKVAGGV